MWNKDAQTIEHILMYSTLHDTAHHTMFDNIIEHIYAHHNTPYFFGEIIVPVHIAVP